MGYVLGALGCLLLGACIGAAIAARVGKMDRKGHVEAVQDAVIAVMSTDSFRTKVLKELGFDQDLWDEEDEDEDEAPVRRHARVFKRSDLEGGGPFGSTVPRTRRKRL